MKLKEHGIDNDSPSRTISFNWRFIEKADSHFKELSLEVNEKRHHSLNKKVNLFFVNNINDLVVYKVVWDLVVNMSSYGQFKLWLKYFNKNAFISVEKAIKSNHIDDVFWMKVNGFVEKYVCKNKREKILKEFKEVKYLHSEIKELKENEHSSMNVDIILADIVMTLKNKFNKTVKYTFE